MEKGKILALEYLNMHYEHCKTLVLSEDYKHTDNKKKMLELQEAIKWAESK